MKKNLITALKKLVTSFGGSAESNNAVDLVDEFADVAAQGGSGTEVLDVLFTEASPNRCDKTYAEMKQAIDDGKVIRCRIYSTYTNMTVNNVNCIYNGQGHTFVLSYINANNLGTSSPSPIIRAYTIAENNSITSAYKNITVS